MIKTSLFSIYQTETFPPRIKKSTFFKNFLKFFGPKRIDENIPRIRISKYSTHSRCDVCVRLQELRAQVKTTEDLQKVRKMTEQHWRTYSDARIAIDTLFQKAQSKPREYLGFKVDDMDNSKSYLPKILEPGKKLVGMEKLKTRITGTILYSSLYPGGRKVHFFLNHDQFAQDSNKMATLTYRQVKMYWKIALVVVLDSRVLSSKRRQLDFRLLNMYQNRTLPSILDAG